MRLSIAIVFLIGAMVVTEVVCDINQNAVEVRELLDKTVKRLESGQTVTHNHQFIYLAIDCMDHLLKSLSPQTLVNRQGISPDTPKRAVDGILVPRIAVIQNDIPSGNQGTVHVKYVLQAIEHVLRGDFVSATDKINESQKTLTGNVSSASSSSKELGSHLFIPRYQVASILVGDISSPALLHDTDRSEEFTHNSGFFDSHYTDKRSNPLRLKYTEGESSLSTSTVVSESVTQIGRIRAWLYYIQLDRANPNDEWILNMMTCVPEIAHALIYSLPDRFLPSDESKVISKFIGRYPVETPNVIGDRIETFVQHITKIVKDEDILQVQSAVLVVKDILKAIRHILMHQWQDAKKVIDKSIREIKIVNLARPVDFEIDMGFTYGLWVPSDLPIARGNESDRYQPGD